MISETALAGFQREADRAGISLIDAVRITVEKGWGGFDSTWNWQSSSAAASIKPKEPPKYIPPHLRGLPSGSGDFIDSTAEVMQ